MRKGIHPKWYPEAQVTCACGNKFTIGTTVPELTVEVCYQCHPFYTGQMKYVDTAGRVQAYQERRKLANKKAISKAERRKRKRRLKLERELASPKTLSELRTKPVSKKKKK